ELDRFVFVELERRAARHAKMHRHLELDAGALGPAAPVLDVVGKALLPRVEIDGRYPLPDIHQRDGNLHRGGRLARTALLIAEYDDVRGGRLARARLDHAATLMPGPSLVPAGGDANGGIVKPALTINCGWQRANH